MDKTEIKNRMRKKNWPARIYIILAVLYGCILINWQIEIIRFSSSLANYVAMLCGLSIPVILIFLAFFFEGWGLKIFSQIIALPFVALSFLLGVFAYSDLASIQQKGFDPSFKPLVTVSLENTQVTAYRTDGGATTSYGIVLRQEKNLLPGILLVKKVEAFYPAYEVDISVLESNTVRIIVPPYHSDQTEQNVVFGLKRWVYI